MAHFRQRLAAGVGVVSVCLSIGGLGLATATADPGGSRGGGSDRGSSSDRDGGHGRHGSKGNHDNRGHRSDVGQRRQSNDGNGNGQSNRDHDRPQSRVGSGRDEASPPMPNARASANAGGAVSANVGGPVSDGRAPATGPALADGPVGETGPAVDAPVVNAIVAPSVGANGGGGSAPAAGPADTFQPPRVTVGNGREPGLQSGDPAPRQQAPAPLPAVVPLAPAPPSPPPAPPPAPPWLQRLSAPPPMPLPGAPTADWTGLWGIAGLLLIPAAGAALGYRQARAAQMADRIHRP